MRVVESRWTIAYLIVVAVFLGAVARYYHAGTGFTFFIEFPERRHERELERVREVPHVDHRGSGGYDGQFYAQLAVDPLLRDPDLDNAIDQVPYRARRILFSWTAHVLGLGEPRRVLHIFAAQNVVAWLGLAWLLCRWFPPVSARAFVLWTSCLFTPGLLASVRYALTDGPSLLVVAAAVAFAERGRSWMAAACLGLAALGRETSIVAAAIFTRELHRSARSWLRAAACVLIVVLPLALWLDYLRSLYRSGILESGQNFVAPLAGWLWKIETTMRELGTDGFTAMNVLSSATLVGLLAQSVCIIRALASPSRRSAWALAAAPFILLAGVLGQPVWDGSPGAYARVLLPLAIGANVSLAHGGRLTWALIVLANLGALPALLWFFDSAP